MSVPSLWKDSHNLGLERSQNSYLVITLKNWAMIVVFPVNTVLGVANLVSFDILSGWVASFSHLDGLDGLGLYQIDLDPLLLVTYFCTPCSDSVWGIIDSWICLLPTINWWKGNWVTLFHCLLNPIRVLVLLKKLLSRIDSYLSLDGLNQKIFVAFVLLDDLVEFLCDTTVIRSIVNFDTWLLKQLISTTMEYATWGRHTRSKN